MKAIILVGGPDVRTQSDLPSISKSMLPIAEKPYLGYLLTYLKKQGIDHIIFSVTSEMNQIKTYFRDTYEGIRIEYLMEEEAMGTGGAIMQALESANLEEPVFVFCGDSFVKLDYRAMYAQHISCATRLTLALHQGSCSTHFGCVLADNKHVTGICRESDTRNGYKNAGIYVINPDLFKAYPVKKKFSFEFDFMLSFLESLRPTYFLTKNYFIDISIPEDYDRAQRELPLMSA